MLTGTSTELQLLRPGARAQRLSGRVRLSVRYRRSRSGPTTTRTDWKVYSAARRGADWANKVLDQLIPSAGVTVVGADDIEGAFFSTEAQAQQWETAFLRTPAGTWSSTGRPTAARPRSASPTARASSVGPRPSTTRWPAGPIRRGSRPCRRSTIRRRAHSGPSIDATGGGHIAFAGALTEHAAVPARFTAAQGWTSLYLALSTVTAVAVTARLDRPDGSTAERSRHRCGAAGSTPCAAEHRGDRVQRGPAGAR